MSDTPSTGFFERYDLYDKGIDAIEKVGGEVRIVFSLFHCDDPERDDETLEYLLTAVFRELDLRVLDGAVPFGEEKMGGEVLDVRGEQGAVVLGVEWRDYVSQLTTYAELALTAEPLRFEEVIRPVGGASSPGAPGTGPGVPTS